MKALSIGIVLATALIFSPGNTQAEGDLKTFSYPVAPEWLAKNAQSLKREKRDQHVSSAALPDPRETTLPDADSHEALDDRGIFEQAGITFGPGSSATFNPATSEITVCNTLDQQRKVEVFLNSLAEKFEKQLLLRFREVKIDNSIQPNDNDGWLEPNLSHPVAATPFLDGNLPPHFLEQLHAGKESWPEVERNWVGSSGARETYLAFSPSLRDDSRQMSDPVEIFCRPAEYVLAEVAGMPVGVITAVADNSLQMKLTLFFAASPSPPQKHFQGVDVLHVSLEPRGMIVVRQVSAPGAVSYLLVTAEDVDGRTRQYCAPKPRELTLKDYIQFAKGSEAAFHGSQQIAKKATAEAKEFFERAIQILPAEHLISDVRRNAYQNQLLQIGPADPPATNPAIEETMRTLLIPAFDLKELPLFEALTFLSDEARRLTVGREVHLPTILLRDVGEAAHKKVTLHLRKVPFVEALRYTTALADCRFEVDGDTIIVSPLGAN